MGFAANIEMRVETDPVDEAVDLRLAKEDLCFNFHRFRVLAVEGGE